MAALGVCRHPGGSLNLLYQRDDPVVGPGVLLSRGDGWDEPGDWNEVREVCRRPLPHDDGDSVMEPLVHLHYV